MLLEYLPSYYKDSKVFAELLKAFSNEINAHKYAISDLENQLFIETSTWGLNIWEKELGIYTVKSKPYSERREAIKAKMRGVGTCTIEMIKNTALAYTNAEVEVIEKNSEYAFIVKFVGVKGVPPNEYDFKRTIEQIKPAHLIYSVEYTYTVWGELKSTAWADVKRGTWKELRTRMVI